MILKQCVLISIFNGFIDIIKRFKTRFFNYFFFRDQLKEDCKYLQLLTFNKFYFLILIYHKYSIY